MSDQALFIRIQNEDERAFAILLDRYSNPLYQLIYRRTRDDDDTKDILQDIFISFWKNKANIVIQESVYPYLCRAAKYAVIDLAVKNQRIVAYQHLLAKTEEPMAHSHEQAVIAVELKQQLDAEVSRMPDTMRQVFKMSKEEHLPARDIAALLQISEQTVRNNLTMALKRLKLRLGPEDLVIALPISMVVSAAIASIY